MYALTKELYDLLWLHGIRDRESHPKKLGIIVGFGRIIDHSTEYVLEPINEFINDRAEFWLWKVPIKADGNKDLEFSAENMPLSERLADYTPIDSVSFLLAVEPEIAECIALCGFTH